MKAKFRFIALLLVLVMLFPLAVACNELTVENKPASEKEVEGEGLAEIPDAAEKTDVKKLLVEALRKKNIDASMASVEAKFKGDLNISFLSPKLSYSTSDIPEAEDGYVDAPLWYLISMLGNTGVGSFENAIYQVLFDTMLDGGYESLEDMFGGLIDNITADKIFADYGSTDGYITAATVGGLFYAIALQTENAYHADDEDGVPDMCMQNIQASASEIMELVRELEMSDDPDKSFESVLEHICGSGIFNVLLCGCSSEEYEIDTTYASLAYILNDVNDYINYHSSEYDEGDRTLYYDALFPYSTQLLLISMATSFAQDEVNHDVLGLVIEKLDEYLASDDGPIMSGEYSKLPLVFAAAAVVESNLEYIFEMYGVSTTRPAYFNLKTETWYDFEGQKITDDFTVISEAPLGYASNIGDEPKLFESVASSKTVYSVYYITYDDMYITKDTYELAFEKLFKIYTDVIDTNGMDEEDEIVFTSVILTYLLSYPQQNYYFDKVIDKEFAQSYILAAICKIGNEDAEKALGETVALFESDNDLKELLVKVLLADYLPMENVEIDGFADEMLVLLCNVFYSLSGSERFDYLDFFREISNHLYVKYLTNSEGKEYDGIPLYVAGGLLYAYAREDLEFDESKCGDVWDDLLAYYRDYYKGMKDNSTYTDEPLVYYEDFAAMLLMLSSSGSLGELKYYDYPFDFAKQYYSTQLMYSVLEIRAQEDVDDNILVAEEHVIYDLFADIYSNKQFEHDRIELISASFMVAFNGYRIRDNGVLEQFAGYGEYLKDILRDAEYDYSNDEYELYDVFEVYVANLFEQNQNADDKTNLRIIIDGILGTEDDAYNTALEASLITLIKNELDTSSPISMGAFLENLDTVLKGNNIYIVSLGDIAATLKLTELEKDDNPLEVMLDVVFSEMFKERAETTECDYTVLTDIILAYLAKDDEALAKAFISAINELSPDYINDKAGDCILLAYLRAFGGVDMAEENTVLANMFTVLYMCEAPYEIFPYIIPALYLNETEFKAICGDAVDVRSWAGKYLPAIINGDDVKTIEAAVEYLLAAGYYEDFEELPEKTDEKYYEKLAALYFSNQYFEDMEKADAVVAYLFGGDISKYADVYLEIANEFSENAEIGEDMSLAQFEITRLALYCVSTKAYLAVDDASTVDWAKALAWIPEIYYEMTETELNIANYRAFSEMLRPTFAEEISSSITATVVPYETATEVILVFTVKGDIDHSAFDCEFEFVIEMTVTKAEYAALIA